MNKLDLIIECFEAWKECSPQYWDGNDDLALTYVRELRDMKPVAWVTKKNGENLLDGFYFVIQELDEGTKLFLLEQSNEP